MQNQELFPALQGPRSDPRFGQISGIKVGTLFENRYGPHVQPPWSAVDFASRKQCYSKGLHTRLYAGISGTTTLGAFSVVLSGGYEDDDDRGNYLYDLLHSASNFRSSGHPTSIYTGTGKWHISGDASVLNDD